MKIKSFSQQGKRSNNEDFTGCNERLWMVCDGVGGHVSGERASRFVVEHMLDLFGEEVPDLDKNRIQSALESVQTDLNKVLDTEPELERMGTTFTGIFKTAAYWYAAHIGDSRIYLFRSQEKKLWHTWDHSLVGELMRHHDITREEGRFHPMSNRISKAVIANSEGKIQTASIVKIDELEPGDIFLLCSDGVVEAWGDYELTRLLSDLNLGFEEKCEKLREQCERLSKDNNTALLLEVEKEDAFSFGHNEELEWVTFQEIEDDYRSYLRKQEADSEDEEDGDGEDQNVVDVSDLLEKSPSDNTAPDIAVAKPDLNSSDTPAANPTPDRPRTAHTKPQTANSEASSGGKKRLALVVVLLLIAAIGIGFLLGRGKSDKAASNEKPKAKTEATSSQGKKENAGVTKKTNTRTGDNNSSSQNATAPGPRQSEVNTAKRQAEAETLRRQVEERKRAEAVAAEAKRKAEEAAETKKKAEAEANKNNQESSGHAIPNFDGVQVGTENGK